MKKNNTATEILRYALAHLEQQREDVQEKINFIHAQLGNDNPGAGGAAVVSIVEPVLRKKRVLSQSARKRIAAAQKKRWAEHRASLGTGARKRAVAA